MDIICSHLLGKNADTEPYQGLCHHMYSPDWLNLCPSCYEAFLSSKGTKLSQDAKLLYNATVDKNRTILAKIA
jgi:hypothetical protein